MVGGEQWGWMTGEGQENFVEHGDGGLSIGQYLCLEVRMGFSYPVSFLLNLLARS